MQHAKSLSLSLSLLICADLGLLGLASAGTHTSQTGHTYVTVNDEWCLTVSAPADTLPVDTTSVCIRIHPDSLLTEAKLDAAGFTTTDILVDSLYGGWYAVSVPPGSNCIAHLDSLESWSMVEWARFNVPFRLFGTPNDTYFSLQWGFQDSMAALPSAWDIVQAHPSIRVAVADNGLEDSHPDLPNFSTVGYVAPSGSSAAHGRAVAGIVAAVTGSDPPRGVAGVAYGADFYFFKDEFGDKELAELLVHAADLGVRVLNCSFGQTGAPGNFPMASTQLDSIMTRNDGQGMVVVCAAGQGGGTETGVLAFPASHPKTIAVGAIEADRSRQPGHADTEDAGADIDVMGPGGTSGIVTTDLTEGGQDPDSDYTLNGAFGGTSSASPFVAGVATLMLSAEPSLKWDEVQTILRHSATKLPGMTGYSDEYFGYGLVNALGAVVGAKYNARPIEGIISQSITLPDTSNGNPLTNLYLTGDLKVAENCTLTVMAGTKIYAAPKDSANLGVDGLKVELIVDGTLVTQGEPGAAVEFACASETEGEWYGISLFSGTGSLDLNYTKIQHGVYGVVSGSYENVWIRNCVFSNNENVDIKIGGEPDSALVKDCYIDVGGGNGIVLQSSAHNVTLEADTLQGALGVSSDGLSLEGPDATVIDCLIRDFKTFADGIVVQAGSPTIRGGEIRNCVSGIYMTGWGSPFVGGTSTLNRFGIQSDCAGPGTCPACSSFSPVVRRNTFLSNTNGIKILSRGFIDLGTASSPGNNVFDDNINNAVWNFDDCDTVAAHGNWFAEFQEVEGLVDTTGSLSVPPQNLFTEYELSVSGASIRVDRNPITDRRPLGITYKSPSASPEQLAIFSVAGKKIRAYSFLGSAEEGRVVWDGRDDRGIPVSTGIYFVALAAKGRMLAVSRVVLLSRGGEQ